jgi:iron complex transport system substrate-binding protein
VFIAMNLEIIAALNRSRFNALPLYCCALLCRGALICYCALFCYRVLMQCKDRTAATVRTLALITGLVLSACLSASESKPGQSTVVSINLCADQLLLLLADSEQILSLSNLSHQSAGSYYYEQAQAYPVNEGHAEQVLTLQPDIVIAGQYSSPYTLDLLREVGLRVETIPIANSIDTMLANITQVSTWLGHNSRGDTIVSELNQRLDALKTSLQNEQQTSAKELPVAAVYDPNGYTSGAQSLRGEMIELSGWRNAAAMAGIQSYGQLSLESIIRLQPDALIESPYSPGTWSRAQAMSQHPALYKAGVDPHIINVPSRKTVCAGPWTVDVIEQMRAERTNLPDTKHTHE